MMQKKLIIACLLMVLSSQVFAEVPPIRTHRPDVPYFLAPMSFQTVPMLVLPAESAGMVIDAYSDLFWNPAFIVRQSHKSLYLDFNSLNNPSYLSVPDFTRYNTYNNSSTDALILPRWYSQTSLNTVKTTPIYNFAAIIPLSSKITVSFMNRSIFDYGPFRSSYDWRSFDQVIPEKTEVQRSDIDENQQTVLGIQSEFILGYDISEKFDLGFRFGHYSYNRNANLFDSKLGVYPHSSFDNLNDESFDIAGHHIALGLGLIYHLKDETLLGFYAGFTKGKSTEDNLSQDSSDTWYERNTNKNYYSDYQYSLESSESYSSDGTRPKIALTFEHAVSTKLKLRSFLSYNWSNIDTSGSTMSVNSTSADRAYDDYYKQNYYFRRRESESKRESGLIGSGENHTEHWNWFASLSYIPEKHWTFFGGVQIQKFSLEQEFEENSDYIRRSQTKYSIFMPLTEKNLHSYKKIYSFDADIDRWLFLLPVGVKLNIKKCFYVILGSDLRFTLVDQNKAGNILYPSRITRKWKNGIMLVNDVETDRQEEYRSSPAKKFDKSLGHRIGIVYEHSSGLKLFIRSFSNILDTTNWALGFEFNW